MKFIVLIIGMLLLGGCAGEHLFIEYPLPDTEEKVENKASSSLKTAVDLFDYSTQPVVVSAYIMHNKPMIIGAYNTGKSEILVRVHNKINKVLRQALVVELKHAGYPVAEKRDPETKESIPAIEASDVIMTGQINSFSASLIRAEVDYLLANVQVYVKVITSKTGVILYESHYLAGAMLEVSDPPDSWDFVEVLENGMIRLVDKIMNDKALIEVLEG